MDFMPLMEPPLLSLHCTYCAFILWNTANCNIIWILDKSFQTCGSCMTINREWMNQWILHDVYKLYYAISQSINQICLYYTAGSLTHSDSRLQQSIMIHDCGVLLLCFAMLFVCLCCFTARELIAIEFLWRQFTFASNDADSTKIRRRGRIEKFTVHCSMRLEFFSLSKFDFFFGKTTDDTELW